MNGLNTLAEKISLAAFLLVALGMGIAAIGVVTPGVFLPGVAAIGVGMLAAGVAGVLHVWKGDE